MPEADLLALALVLIPALPLGAALWIALGFIFGWNRGEAGETETAQAAVWTASAACLLVLILAVYSLFNGALGTQLLFNWLESGNYQVSISFLPDPLALSVAACFSVMILLATRFSVAYLHREAGFQRYFMVLCLFHSAVLLMVLAGNALLAFIGWELAALASYLLIGYVWQRETATRNATRAWVTNRVGDAGFLLALYTSLSYLGSSEWVLILERAPQQPSMTVAVIVFGLLLAALVKSAQFPFSAWITRALEGPTPSSAVFYGAVLVHAGIYLLLRMAPLLEQVPLLTYLLLLLGSLTVVYSWLSVQVQTDVKRSLVLATLLQLGLMLIEIALGWTTLASVHLVLHVIWRTYQFLQAPSFLQLTTAPAPSSPHWLQGKTWLYTAAQQGFWLDQLTDWLLVKPTRQLAQEAQVVDEHIINRITGVPVHTHLAIQQVDHMGSGSGLLGKLLQNCAQWLEWFEEKLVLKGGQDGLAGMAAWLGTRAEIIEHHLRQPRYLLVMLAATLVVIL